jgi:polysaccharide biosynthesis/export protein
MKSKSLTLAALLCAVMLPAAGFTQNSSGSSAVKADNPSPPLAQAAETTSAASPRALVIGAGDLLDVSLYDVPDFKTEVRVAATGVISLPMVGDVAVAGLSVGQAQHSIEQELGRKRLFNDPQVTVFVKESAAEGISVLGEVQKPGIYTLLGSRRLYDAISAAGGITPKAGRYALITHRDDPQHPVRVPFSTSGSNSARSNVAIDPGDTIVVSKAGIVYVVGDVRQPGGFVMDNDGGITVLQALALARGIGPNPSLNASRLIRKTPDGPKDVPLPLKKILAAKAPDEHLQAGDILFVPGSAAKSAAKRGAEAILQMATGVAIWRIP